MKKYEILFILKSYGAFMGLSFARGYWMGSGMPGGELTTQGVQFALLLLLSWYFYRSYQANRARSEAAKAAAEKTEIELPQA